MSNEEKNMHAQMLIDEMKTISAAMGTTGFTSEAALKAKGQLKVFRKNLADYTKHFAGRNDEVAQQLGALADQFEERIQKDSPEAYI